MLTEKLREKELFKEDVKQEESKHDALRLLNDQIESLIVAMRAVEDRGDWTREEVESYVLRRMEYHEAHIYRMGDIEFTLYIAKKLFESFEELEEI